MIKIIDFKIRDLNDKIPHNKTLFYPCCGSDFISPIASFHDIIDTFYFCCLEDQQIDNTELQKWLLGFKLVSNNVKVKFPVKHTKIENRGYNEQKKAEKYLDVWKNIKTGREIKIYRVIQDGLTMLLYDPILSQIGIFFYRGDGSGDGGSGIGWLMTDKDKTESYLEYNIHHVLQRLSENGLIVTDGSNSGVEYRFFYDKNKYDIKRNDKIFHCLGKISSSRDNQTVVWQVSSV